ncbi:hypothetical protein IQ266_15415 [filamentous cyanobacterium LEGE 11480]|uniref:Uncharacterized protein n=1 Tax=Romeriopsis navalis LEGE 11480 TaxID=2777977 RepID=A0A928VP06_9CYAN|nr:hypothetical protein [Romeriopsis navalis]MBE9031122.1 hypothetical protein [Romeriopsis navalis LEGE 11480]
MQLLTFSLLALYTVVMPLLFSNWYGLYLNEPGMNASQRQTSRIVLMLATLLWPIVLPMSYLELLKKVKRYERQNLMTQPNFVSLPEMY